MSWQEEFHSYGLLWEPGKLVRWYLDGVAVFEVDDVALKERVRGGLRGGVGRGAWGKRGREGVVREA